MTPWIKVMGWLGEVLAFGPAPADPVEPPPVAAPPSEAPEGTDPGSVPSEQPADPRPVPSEQPTAAPSEGDAGPAKPAPLEPAPPTSAPSKPAAPSSTTPPPPGDEPEPAPAREPEPAAEEPEDGEVDLGLAGLLNETVVAAASRSAESSADAPATTQVISGTDLYRYGVRSLDEAFNYLSLAIHAELGSSTPDVGVRGITIPQDFGNHILLTIDGHVVNEASVGYSALDYAAAIPIELVDRIEIVYGPGSVLYGNHAMLAVVNVVMKDGKAVDGFHVIGEGGVSPNQNRHGNLENLDWGHVGRRGRTGLQFGREFDVGRRKLDWVIAGEYIDEASPKYQYGPQYEPALEGILSFGPNTGYSDPDIWGGNAGERGRGAYGYTKMKVEGLTLQAKGSWMSLSNPNGSLNFNPSRGLSIANSFVDARYDYDVSRKVSGMARLYFDHQLLRNYIQFPAQVFCSTLLAPCEITIDSESLRGGVENQWRFDWFADGRYSTMLGVDAAVRSADAYAVNIGADGQRDWQDFRYDVVDENIGVYAQQIARVHRRIRFNVGARFDHFRYANAVSPRAAAIFDPWAGGTVKLIYSQAFRAPTRGELVDDPDIESEVVRGGEVSLSQAIGPHHLTVAAFGSVWDTVITRKFERDPANPAVIAVTFHNVNKIYGLGGNLGYRATLGRWDWGLNANYAYNRTRVGDWGTDDIVVSDDDLVAAGLSRQAADRWGRDQPLSLSPSFSGNARLAYSIRRGPTLAAAFGVLGPRIIREAYARPELLDLVDQGFDMTLPTKVSGRFTVSGLVKRLSWLDIGYRVALDWTSNVYTPHLVGPFKVYRVGDDRVKLDLHQNPRLTVFGGLDLRFGVPQRSKQ